ncbi:MAG: hypothetical protein KDC98_24150 [Planctomycetes bacterium]|nr:hypothetical protein [Planctomycetota bacterium]
MHAKRILSLSAAFALATVAASAQSQSPFQEHQSDPLNRSTGGWTNVAYTWNNLLKICSLTRIWTGELQIPIEPQVSCGMSVTISQGTKVSGSVTVPLGSGSVSASVETEVDTAFTLTAGPCERVGAYMRYPNSSVQPWECECFISFWSYDCSYVWVELGGPAILTKNTMNEPACNCGPTVPATTTNLRQTSLSGETIAIDLGRFFATVQGTPAPGNPLVLPHDTVAQLNYAHRSAIEAVVQDAQAHHNVTFDRLMIVEANGTVRSFDLIANPFPLTQPAFGYPFGYGCPATAPLTLRSLQRPIAGTVVSLEMSQIPAGSALGILAFSFRPQAPVIDLGVFGFAGCSQYVQLSGIALGVPIAGATAILPFPVPSGFGNFNLHAQAATFGTSVATSNGLQLAINTY